MYPEGTPDTRDRDQLLDEVWLVDLEFGELITDQEEVRKRFCRFTQFKFLLVLVDMVDPILAKEALPTMDLPHLLGTITNLDGAQSMRALASINAEIHRRERLFGQYGVNHINQYQKKFKLGEATEPLPHLFLISDEFAELKVNQPDFIKELVSIARVGRSLGVHLILATQKPSGVVDDQIWSNSRFKLALKVADRGDSMEMTADGRCG